MTERTPDDGTPRPSDPEPSPSGREPSPPDPEASTSSRDTNAPADTDDAEPPAPVRPLSASGALLQEIFPNLDPAVVARSLGLNIEVYLDIDPDPGEPL
jgi:hypothetical protein